MKYWDSAFELGQASCLFMNDLRILLQVQLVQLF